MAARDDLTKEIELRLGGGMVDVELDPEHYNLAITKSLEKYRQRSENAVEESFLVLQLKLDLNEPYNLINNSCGTPPYCEYRENIKPDNEYSTRSCFKEPL